MSFTSEYLSTKVSLGEMNTLQESGEGHAGGTEHEGSGSLVSTGVTRLGLRAGLLGAVTALGTSGRSSSCAGRGTGSLGGLGDVGVGLEGG